jgi:FkbM family methyltransferase
MLMNGRLRTIQSARSFREKINAVKSLSSSPYDALLREMSPLGVENVIDGGANVGQFGLDLYRHGFAGSIYSYEPISQIFNRLQRTSMKYQKWHTFNLGLGLRASYETINISGNAGLSSSILEMNESHLINFPSSGTVAKEKIQITNIADQIKILDLNPSNLAIKLDVQGFEYQALLGVGEFLEDIPICFLELSINSLYEGEHDYLEILKFLAHAGHDVVDLFRGVTAKNGGLLQIDIVTKQRKYR